MKKLFLSLAVALVFGCSVFAFNGNNGSRKISQVQEADKQQLTSINRQRGQLGMAELGLDDYLASKTYLN